MDFKDYYAALSVKKNASAEEIKQAYRRLAKQHHPDLHLEKDKASASTKFKEINEAYEVLSDPDKKAKYDDIGPGWDAGPGPGPRPAETARERSYAGGPYQGPGGREDEGFEGFSDFFETLFGQEGARGFGRTGRGRAPGGPYQGPGGPDPGPGGGDVEAELPLSLEDCLRPGDRKLSMRVPSVCHRCRGAGRIGRHVCPSCAGVGETVQEKSITVHLPDRIRDGMRLRLRGQGHPAPGGGAAGDLFLRIRLLPHPRFKVSGSDLETTVTLMPWEASLGGEVTVAALEGPLRVRVPAGTHAGRRLRVTGKGLPNEGGARGDLFALVHIDIPQRSNERTERLYRELKEAAS